MTVHPGDDGLTRLVRRAFVGTPTDLGAYRVVYPLLRPVADRVADDDVAHRLGRVATESDRAEARDLLWRAIVAELRADVGCDGTGSPVDWARDRARALARTTLRVLDLRLIQRWQQGDARAGDQIERRLRAVIYVRAKRVLVPAGWNRDAVAEAACAAWTKVVPALRRWRPDGGQSLENWVGVSVEHAAQSMLRDAAAAMRQGIEVPSSGDEDFRERPDPGPTPEEAARRADFAERLSALARAHLSETEYAVVVDDLLGASLDEIIDKHEVSKNFTYKARAKLKRLWSDSLHEPP